MARKPKSPPKTFDPTRFTPGPMQLPDTAAALEAEQAEATRAAKAETLRFFRSIPGHGYSRNPDIGTEEGSDKPVALYRPRGQEAFFFPPRRGDDESGPAYLARRGQAVRRQARSGRGVSRSTAILNREERAAAQDALERWSKPDFKTAAGQMTRIEKPELTVDEFALTYRVGDEYVTVPAEEALAPEGFISTNKVTDWFRARGMPRGDAIVLVRGGSELEKTIRRSDAPLPGLISEKKPGELIIPASAKFSPIKRERVIPAKIDEAADVIKRGVKADIVAYMTRRGTDPAEAEKIAGRLVAEVNKKQVVDIMAMSKAEFVAFQRKMERLAEEARAEREVAPAPVIVRSAGTVVRRPMPKTATPPTGMTVEQRRVIESGVREQAKAFRETRLTPVEYERLRELEGKLMLSDAQKAELAALKQKRSEQKRRSDIRKPATYRRIRDDSDLDGLSTPVLGIGALLIAGLGVYTLYTVFQASKPPKAA